MIVVRKGIEIIRCDGCGSAPDNIDKFDAFYISWPAGFHAITDEPLVKWLSFKHNAGIPATMHTCPNCAKRVRGSLKVNKLELLPNGPLKKYLLDIVAKADNKFRAFQLHFMKDSKLGHS
jgi:hypothetical protein